jgi:BCD family chlorophyll transporter-like MFS transporter
MARTQGTLGSGLILGAWGSAQATAAGLAILAGGTLRDVVTHIVDAGLLGPLHDISLGYTVVYHVEIALLFITLAALGPLVRIGTYTPRPDQSQPGLRLTEFPT